jgi:membrane protein YqaA with SNARE-associated domain
LDFLISIHPLIASAGNLIRHIGGILDGPAMFLIALLDSSFLSIPEGNDILIVGLSIGKAWSRIAYYVAVTAAGSITGHRLAALP